MDNIEYTFRGLSLEQFATLFEPKGDNIHFDVTVPIMANYDERAFAVGINIKFTEDDKPFMTAELFCHFVIENDCWNKLSENCSKDVVLPKNFMNTLVRIAIGSIRGALYVKTENTPFSKFFLPIIEIGSADEGSDYILAKTNNK